MESKKSKTFRLVPGDVALDTIGRRQICYYNVTSLRRYLGFSLGNSLEMSALKLKLPRKDSNLE